MRSSLPGTLGRQDRRPQNPVPPPRPPDQQVHSPPSHPQLLRPEPCRHAARPPPLSGPSAPASLTRAVLHLLTPLLASRGWDCPAQGTEDWGHPGTYLSTELVSCMVAVQGIQNEKQNWPVAPHGKRTWSPEGPQISTGPPVPGPHPELSPTGSGWGWSAGRGDPSPQSPVFPPRRLSPCLNQKEKWGQS